MVEPRLRFEQSGVYGPIVQQLTYMLKQSFLLFWLIQFSVGYALFHSLLPSLVIVHLEEDLEDMVYSQMAIRFEIHILAQRKPRHRYLMLKRIVIGYLLQTVMVHKSTDYVHLAASTIMYSGSSSAISV